MKITGSEEISVGTEITYQEYMKYYLNPTLPSKG
jgi:hypothetical protein